MRDKASVEIDEAKETLELFDGHGLRIVSDGLDMRGKGRDTGGRDVVSEEINGGLSKRTLFRIDKDTVGSQDGENLVKVMVEMLLEGRAGNEDNIQVNKCKREILEDVVHEALESLGSVAEAIRHVEIFIISYRPKGVMTAVLGMSGGWTGTW